MSVPGICSPLDKSGKVAERITAPTAAKIVVITTIRIFSFKDLDLSILPFFIGIAGGN